MNFQNIPEVESPQAHLDVAFKRGKILAEHTKEKLKKKGRLTIQRIREIERVRFEASASNLMSRFQRILRAFPVIKTLGEFYRELIDATIGTSDLEKALSSIAWAAAKIHEIYLEYNLKLKKMSTPTAVHNCRKAFYGRLSSICKEQERTLHFLDGSRKKMRTYPVILNLPTAAIAGFPNVGKTTLLSEISTSKPEIAEYAFTTKHINIGYIQHENTKIQLLDTPGTLARPSKMNAIEKQAYLAIRHLAAAIVYVFDPTEQYPFSKQAKLYEQLKETKKPLMAYLSKTDVAQPEIIEKFRSNYPEIIISKNELKRWIFEALD